MAVPSHGSTVDPWDSYPQVLLCVAQFSDGIGSASCSRKASALLRVVFGKTFQVPHRTVSFINVALMAPEASKRDAPEWVEPAPRNRQLSTEPVVLSDGSEDAPKAPVDKATVAPAVAAPAALKKVPSLTSAPAPAAIGSKPVRREAPVVPPPALVPSQVQPPPVAETEAAWGNLVFEGLRTVETAERSATAGPSAFESEVPVNREPDGSIGAPEVNRAPMIGPLL